MATIDLYEANDGQLALTDGERVIWGLQNKVGARSGMMVFPDDAKWFAEESAEALGNAGWDVLLGGPEALGFNAQLVASYDLETGEVTCYGNLGRAAERYLGFESE